MATLASHEEKAHGATVVLEADGIVRGAGCGASTPLYPDPQRTCELAWESMQHMTP